MLRELSNHVIEEAISHSSSAGSSIVEIRAPSSTHLLLIEKMQNLPRRR